MLAGPTKCVKDQFEYLVSSVTAFFFLGQSSGERQDADQEQGAPKQRHGQNCDVAYSKPDSRYAGVTNGCR
jgi:hypothetical protein